MDTTGVTPILRCVGLRVGFGDRVLIDGADFSLLPGELVGLIGLNGAGKSSLLRVLADMEAPMRGSVEVDGTGIDRLSARMRARRLSMVLSGRPKAGAMLAAELVALGRHPWTGPYARLDPADPEASEAMRITGTESLALRRFDTLSDGEAQRVLVARALAQDTPCMLLDEPTAHLDLVNRVLLLRLLRRIAQERMRAVLVATHDLATAMQECHRLLILHDGALWSGSPAEARDSGRLASVFEREGLRLDGLLGSDRK